jgi:hypothetical protein
MNRDWAADEVDPMTGGGQLQHQVLEDHGIVVAHDSFMFARRGESDRI